MSSSTPKGLGPQLAKDVLMFCLSHPDIAITVAVNDMRDFVIDSARSRVVEANFLSGQGKKDAWIKIKADDALVKALRGEPENSPGVFLLVALPTEAVALTQEALDVLRSPIIRPGDN